MFVARRVWGCASETAAAAAKTAANAQTIRPGTPPRAHSLFTLHHLLLCCCCQYGSEAREQQCAGDVAARTIVKERDHVADRLESCDMARAHQDREQDAAQRASRDQSGAEQRSRADLRFLLRSGPVLDIRADEAADENRRRRRDREIRPDGEGQRTDAAELERHGDEDADEDEPPRQVLAE